jgi:hypothetical protein
MSESGPCSVQCSSCVQVGLPGFQASNTLDTPEAAVITAKGKLKFVAFVDRHLSTVVVPYIKNQMPHCFAIWGSELHIKLE